MTSLLLAGAMLVATGCTDYKEDIEAVNDRLDNQVGAYDPSAGAGLSLAEQVSTLEKALEELQGVHAEDLAKLNETLATLKSQLEAADAALAEAITAGDAAVEGKLNAAVESLNGAIANAEAAAKAYADQKDATLLQGIMLLLEETKEELEDADKALDAKIQALVAADVEINGKIAALETRVAQNEADIQNLISLTQEIQTQITELQLLVNTKLDAVTFEEYKAATALTLNQLLMAAQVTEITLGEHDGRLTALEANLEALSALHATDIETLTAELAAQKSAYEAWKQIVDLTLGELDGRMTLVESDLDALEEAHAKLESEYNQWKQVVDVTLGEHDGRLTDLEAGAEALQQALSSLESQFNLWKQVVDLTLGEHDGRLTDLETATAALAAEDARLAALIQANTDAFNQFKQVVDITLGEHDGRLTDLEAEVGKLLARIQSITYVPTHLNGLIHVNYAKAGAIYLDGTTDVVYKVLPEEAAQAILLAYNTDPSILSIASEEVTRGVDTTFEIVGVSDADADGNVLGNGKVRLSVKMNKLGDDFYALTPGKNAYAIALTVNSAAATGEYGEKNDIHISSCYTGLQPVVAPVEIVGLNIKNAAGDLIGQSAAITDDAGFLAARAAAEAAAAGSADVKLPILGLSYTSTATAPIHEGHYVVLEDADGNYYTLDQWNETSGYGTITLTDNAAWQLEAKVVNGVDATLTDCLKYAPVAEGSIYKAAAVNKAEAGSVNYTDLVGYKYSYAGLETYAYAEVAVTKITPKMTLDLGTIYWNYSEDADEDAVGGGDIYSRLAYTIAIATAADGTAEMELNYTEFPTDFGPADVIDPASAFGFATDNSKTKKYYNGAVTTSKPFILKPVYYATTQQTLIAPQKFDFVGNGEYKIEYTYSSPSADVLLTINFKVVDRDRAALTFPYGVVEYNYVKDFNKLNDTANKFGIEDIFAKVKEVNAALGNTTIFTKADGTEWTAAEYLKDIYADKTDVTTYPLYALASTVNSVAATANTGINLYPATAPTYATLDYLFSDAAITADANNKVIKELAASHKTTTWYGQEITLEKGIKLLNPVNKYALVETSFVGGDEANKPWWTQVVGQYTTVAGDWSAANLDADTDALAEFRTSNVDVDKAFNIKDANKTADNGVMTAAEIAAAGLKKQFELKAPYTDINWASVAGSWSSLTDHILVYNSHLAQVNVEGYLLVENSDATLFEIDGAFDYYKGNYVIKQYDPIQPLKSLYPAEAPYRVAVTDAIKYGVNIYELYELYENRHLPAPYVNKSLINDTKTGLTVGDDYNGFAAGRTMGDVYTLTVSSLAGSIAPEYASYVDWNVTTPDVLTLDATGELQLVKPLKIKLTLSIDYPWATAAELSQEAWVEFYNPNI